MAAVISCPDHEALQGLMAGRIPEPENEYLAQHLEGCPSCAAVVATLRAEDTLLGAVAAHPAERPDGSAVAVPSPNVSVATDRRRHHRGLVASPPRYRSLRSAAANIRF